MRDHRRDGTRTRRSTVSFPTQDQDLLAADDRDFDHDEDLAYGSTVVLTAEGWETAEYIDPGPDWRLLEDGSFLSPDGRTQSRPLVNPSPMDV
jgi:hypothetical protein